MRLWPELLLASSAASSLKYQPDTNGGISKRMESNQALSNLKNPGLKVPNLVGGIKPLFGGIDPNFMLYELLGDHLSFHDLANLGAVSKDLAAATKPIIDIANLCKPQSVYPNLVINRDPSAECLELLEKMFRSGHKLFKFKEIRVYDWRILAAGVPVTHLTLSGYKSFTNRDWRPMAEALATYQGKITISMAGLRRAHDPEMDGFFREAIISSPFSELEINNCDFDNDYILESLNNFLRLPTNRVKSLTFSTLELSPAAWTSFLNSVAAMPVLETLIFHSTRVEGARERAMGISRILAEAKTLQAFRIYEHHLDRDLTIPFLRDGLGQATSLKRIIWNAPLNGYYMEFGETVASLPNLESLSIEINDWRSRRTEEEFLAQQLAQNNIAGDIGLNQGNRWNLHHLIASFPTFKGPLKNLNLRISQTPELITDLASILPLLDNLESLSIHELLAEQDIRAFCDTLVSSSIKPPKLSKLEVGLGSGDEDAGSGDENTGFWRQETKKSFLGLLEMLQRRNLVGLDELIIGMGEPSLPIDFAEQILLVSGAGDSIVNEAQNSDNILSFPQPLVPHKIKRIKFHRINKPETDAEWKSFARVLGKCDQLETLGIYFKGIYFVNNPLAPDSMSDVGKRKRNYLDRLGRMLSNDSPKSLTRIIMHDAREYLRFGKKGIFIPITKRPVNEVWSKFNSFRPAVTTLDSTPPDVPGDTPQDRSQGEPSENPNNRWRTWRSGFVNAIKENMSAAFYGVMAILAAYLLNETFHENVDDF